MGNLLSLIAALTAIISVYIAWKAVNESYRPDVVVYMFSNRDDSTFAFLCIENAGNQTAHNIFFTPDRPIPFKAFGSGSVDQKFTKSIFQNGIGTLNPREKIIFLWGDYHGLKEALNNRPIKIGVSYYGVPVVSATSKHKRYVSNNVIDLSNYQYTHAGATAIKMRVTEVRDELKKINNNLSSIKSKLYHEDNDNGEL